MPKAGKTVYFNKQRGISFAPLAKPGDGRREFSVRQEKEAAKKERQEQQRIRMEINQCYKEHITGQERFRRDENIRRTKERKERAKDDNN